MKVIRGTTPSWDIIFKDADGVVVDPTTYSEVRVEIYNQKDGSETVKFTTETPPPTGWSALTVTPAKVAFKIPEAKSSSAKSGDNRIDVWTRTPLGGIDCQVAARFIEFIDAKDGA